MIFAGGRTPQASNDSEMSRCRMNFRFSDVVRATPEETLEWWTDLREDDAGRVMPPLRERRIIRGSAGEIETEDRWSIFGMPMKTRAVLRFQPPHGWEVRSHLRGGWTRDIVRLERVSGGTKVTMDMEMHLRWPWTWMARVARKRLEKLFLDDLRAVNRRLEESLSAPRP